VLLPRTQQTLYRRGLIHEGLFVPSSCWCSMPIGTRSWCCELPDFQQQSQPGAGGEVGSKKSNRESLFDSRMDTQRPGRNERLTRGETQNGSSQEGHEEEGRQEEGHEEEGRQEEGHEEEGWQEEGHKEEGRQEEGCSPQALIARVDEWPSVLGRPRDPG